jgi:hypothetical protein
MVHAEATLGDGGTDAIVNDGVNGIGMSCG